MTVIRPNSISGVTSITAHGGDITYFKSDGTGGNQFTHNIQSTGVITATKFVGPIEATTGTFTGNLGVGGVLTYEDVTNIDSVGVITARNGGYLDIRTGSSINTNVTGASASGTLHKNTNSGEFAVVSGGTGGNNHLSFYTSASASPTEKLRINSTGEVGIGTVTPDSTGGVGGGGLHIHGPQSDNCRLVFTTPTKNHPKPAIGFFGLNRFGMDTWDGLEIRDVTASYATRFKIDENGYRTIPNQPNFLTLTHTAALSANNYNYIVIASTHINVGTCYNGSNGRFTAPIDGYYFFYGMYTGQNNVSGPVMGFHKNGGSHQGEALNYNATYDGTSMQQVKQLSAGDYVNWSMRDWNGQTPDPWHTWWGGYLLY
tara:strand:+ start:1 stop:1116 length:1116 start_codon:yes stop_codon:yes gene_type:complete